MSQCQFGNFENREAGLYFSKISQFQLFAIFQKCPNLVGGEGGEPHFSKMSEIQKCPNLVRGEGVNIFQKYPKFKNVPKVGRGEVNPNWDIVPNFLDFLF